MKICYVLLKSARGFLLLKLECFLNFSNRTLVFKALPRTKFESYHFVGKVPTETKSIVNSEEGKWEAAHVWPVWEMLMMGRGELKRVLIDADSKFG